MKVSRWLAVLGVLAGLGSLATEARAQVGSPDPGTTYVVAVDSTVSGQFDAEMNYTETGADVFLNLISFREGNLHVLALNGPNLHLDGVYFETNINLGGLQVSTIEAAADDGAQYSTEFSASYFSFGPLSLLTGAGAGTVDDEYTFSALLLSLMQ